MVTYYYESTNVRIKHTAVHNLKTEPKSKPNGYLESAHEFAKKIFKNGKIHI